jgi:hypothetical protein
MTLDYKYWADALSGNFGPVHDGHPQCGFYKRRASKNGHFNAVAIWKEANDKIVASEIKADKSVSMINADDIWAWICRAPISEAEYRRIERGDGWSDGIESLIGSNNPPADELQSDEIQSAIDVALAQLNKPILSQTDCDLIANHLDRLSKLWTSQEKQRKEQKQPHLDAGKTIDDLFNPVLVKIKDAGEKLKSALTKWMIAEKTKADDLAFEQRKREEEARKCAEVNNQPEPELIVAPEPFKPKAGTVGRTVALRTFKSAVITDYAKALTAVAENSEIKELVQTLADRAARADIALAGCEIKLEQRAA